MLAINQSKTVFLMKAFDLSLPDPPQEVTDAWCAMSGEELQLGYPLKSIISSATADIATTFPFGGAFVSESVAALFKSPDMRGNILAMPDKGVYPLISKEAADTQARPCWRDLIMHLPLNTPTVAIISDESKRRLWPSAKLSLFGNRWQPFFNGVPYKNGRSHAAAVQRTLLIDVSKLRDLINLVEKIYSWGFSKMAIATGLLGASALVETFGLSFVRSLDQQLMPERGSDELLLSCFVAQKTEVELPEIKAIKPNAPLPLTKESKPIKQVSPKDKEPQQWLF